MTAEETGNTAAGTVPLDNEQAVLDDIARTREELGETVAALTAKADVKARAQEKVAEVSDRVKGRAQDLKNQVTGHADGAKTGLADKTATARQKIVSASAPVAAQVKGQLVGRAGQAAQAGTAALNAAPEPVQQTARRAAGKVSENRVQFAVGAGSALVVGWLLYRWARR